MTEVFNREKVKKLISDYLNSLKKEDLKTAIQTNLNLVKILFNHYKLSEPHVKFIARPILKFWWDSIEETLTNPQIILDNIEKDELKEILSTEEGIDWINGQSEALYASFYNYLFFKIDPVSTYQRN